MAKTTLNDGVSALNFRTYLNNMFTELYTYGFMKATIARSAGTPSTGDPASFDTVTHTITGYTNAPKVILIPKCDWHVYISSVSNTTIVVGVGSFGSGITLDYDLVVISTDI